MTDANITRSNTDRSDQTRARILAAAIREFSYDGMAGARTERIAEAAGVNKALLYYYFTSKQALYDAALEDVANRVVASSMAAMSSTCSAGERLVQFALNHFDRIHSNRAFQNLMQQEMIRLRRGEENALAPMVDKVFLPMMSRFRQVCAEGSASGELIQVDELQIMYAALGANVFYFLSAPIMGMLTGTNPFDRSALEFRRQAAIEYLGKTIFIDREHGARVAANVLAATPMPQPVEIEPQAIETDRTENHESDTLAKTHEVRHK
jgi:TetR/AcrR family transcriptional regulator